MVGRIQVLKRVPNNDILKSEDWKEYESNIFTSSGRYEFLLGITDVSIDTSLDNLTETATIKINKKYLTVKGSNYIEFEYSNSITEDQLGVQPLLTNNYDDGDEVGQNNRGTASQVFLNEVIDINIGQVDVIHKDYPDSIDEIELNENGPRKRFQGYVVSFSEDDDNIIINCEDNMSQLKRLENKNVNFGTITLLNLIKKIEEEWNIELDYDENTIINMTLDRFTVEFVNPADIFEFIKKQSGISIYFRRNRLYAGLKYWNVDSNRDDSSSNPDYGRIFRFSDPWFPPFGNDPTAENTTQQQNGTNPIISKDLEYSNVSSDNLNIIVVSKNSIDDSGNKTKNTLIGYYNGTKLEIYNSGDEIDDEFKKDISQRKVIRIPNKSKADIKDILVANYQKRPRVGYTGTITTFIKPLIVKGDLILLNLFSKTKVEETGIADTRTNIVWDKRLSTNYIFNGSQYKYNEDVFTSQPSEITSPDGEVFKIKNTSENRVQIYLPFWLYVASDVTYTYSATGGMRQIIRIEKIPKSYLPDDYLIDSLKQFKTKR